MNTNASGGEEHTHEEGELIDSTSECRGEKEREIVKTPMLTQQSSVPDSIAAEMETEGEELVDYEEEPTSNEMTEMANLEKSMEERANKLLEDQAIKIPLLDGSDTTLNSSEDTDEIDWDKVDSNLLSDEEKDTTTVREEKVTRMETRRSSRNLGGAMKIQEKAEANKKKYNEISGKNSSFSILNLVDPQILESIAMASNINLGGLQPKLQNQLVLYKLMRMLE
jgi:hypothetical protein